MSIDKLPTIKRLVNGNYDISINNRPIGRNLDRKQVLNIIVKQYRHLYSVLVSKLNDL